MKAIRTLALPVLAFAFTVSGLQAQQPAEQQRTGEAQVERSGGRHDQQIEQRANQELQRRDQLRNVRASVEDGIVTLQGTVERLNHKNQAERRVRGLDNVSGVRNQVEVNNRGIGDAQLREQVASRLAYDRIGRGIMFNHLTVDVREGVVRVGGNVRDEVDRASAIAIVENTAGVRDVMDEIEVAPASIRDDELRVQMARAIYGHPTLQRYAMNPVAPIRIVVERGQVSLHGVVQNRMDRQIAEMQARQVPGAFSVQNHLVVAGEQEQAPAEE